MSSLEEYRNRPMRNTFYFLIILSIAIFLIAITIPVLPFDSDQAIVGLMSKHILNGAFPWLYYGDSYSGILEPLLVSWSFLFFGINQWSLHLIPGLFSILFIISIYQLARELFNREMGLLSMLLAAIPLFPMGYYRSLAYGGYIEILWLGNIILLISHRLALQKKEISLLLLFFFGLLWGIAWWTYPISIVYLIAGFSFLFLIRRELAFNGKLLSSIFGFFLGSTPFWIWNGLNQFPFLSFSQSQENPDYFYRFQRFYHKFIEFFTTGLKGDVNLLAFITAAFFGLSLFFLIIGHKRLRRQFPANRGSTLLLLFFLIFCSTYIGSRFSEQNASRYLLPLYSLIPITMALVCYTFKKTRKIIFFGLFALLFLIHIYHQFSLNLFLQNFSVQHRKQLAIEQTLVDFIRKKNISYVYTPEYWSAAKLTFNANEYPVFCQPFKERYPLYTLRADALLNPFFVLEGKYRQSFEEMFKAAGGSYKKEVFSSQEKIKGYVLYYDFHPPVSDGLEILPDGWKGKSNSSPDSKGLAFDRNISSFWTSSAPQQSGMFYQIDLGRVYQIKRVVFGCGKGKERDFPAFYRIEISAKEGDWKKVASVKNNWTYLFWSGGRPFWKLKDGRIEINFCPQEARFIRVTLTGPAPQAWSLGEIFVYQTHERPESKPVSAEELISFLSKEKIEYVYADFGLSAQITHHTQGTIKCLQEDYDLTFGEDSGLGGYNGAFPYLNRLKKVVDFSLRPAFVVARENQPSFIRALDTIHVTYSVKNFRDHILCYGIKVSGPGKIKGEGRFGSFYWNGTHLLPMGQTKQLITGSSAPS